MESRGRRVERVRGEILVQAILGAIVEAELGRDSVNAAIGTRAARAPDRSLAMSLASASVISRTVNSDPTASLVGRISRLHENVQRIIE